jgi:hypothetical protein
VVYDAHVLAVNVVVLKPGGVAYSRVCSLFSIIPSNFEVAQTGACARLSLASPGGFDLRACVCFVTWDGRGVAVGWPWDGRGAVGAAVLVLVVTVYVGGSRFVGGRCRRSRGCRSALILQEVVTCYHALRRDAAGLVLRTWPRACLFGFYERLSASASRPPARRAQARRLAGAPAPAPPPQLAAGFSLRGSRGSCGSVAPWSLALWAVLGA